MNSLTNKQIYSLSPLFISGKHQRRVHFFLCLIDSKDPEVAEVLLTWNTKWQERENSCQAEEFWS